MPSHVQLPVVLDGDAREWCQLCSSSLDLLGGLLFGNAGAACLDNMQSCFSHSCSLSGTRGTLALVALCWHPFFYISLFL